MTVEKDIRDRAEELYIIDGLTLEAVAEEAGASLGSVKRWAVDGGWGAKRREYQDAESEIRRYSRLARLKLIKDAMTSLDPQKIYAFAALERASTSFRQGEESAVAEAMADGVSIETPQEAIAALQEAISRRLNLMLAKPDVISLSGIKDMKKAMELVEEMKREFTGEKEEIRSKQLDNSTIKRIREEIYGLN